MALVAGGMVEQSLPWIISGLVLLALGAASSLYGGVLHDAHSTFSPRQEAHDVITGRAHPGTAADARIESSRAQVTGSKADAQRRALLARTRRAPRPNLVPVGAALVLVVCTWLLIAQWSIYPHSQVGQNNAVRDLGVGIVLALGALRVALVGRRPLVTTILLAGGLALVIFALLMPHVSAGIIVSELLCGALVLTGAALTLDTGGLRRPAGQS